VNEPSSIYLLKATRLSLKYAERSPGPTSTTVPEPSQPGVYGYLCGILYKPLINIMSDGLIAERSTFISTWLGPGLGTGT